MNIRVTAAHRGTFFSNDTQNTIHTYGMYETLVHNDDSAEKLSAGAQIGAQIVAGITLLHSSAGLQSSVADRVAAM